MSSRSAPSNNAATLPVLSRALLALLAFCGLTIWLSDTGTRSDAGFTVEKNAAHSVYNAFNGSRSPWHDRQSRSHGAYPWHKVAVPARSAPIPRYRNNYPRRIGTSAPLFEQGVYPKKLNGSFDRRWRDLASADDPDNQDPSATASTAAWPITPWQSPQPILAAELRPALSSRHRPQAARAPPIV